MCHTVWLQFSRSHDSVFISHGFTNFKRTFFQTHSFLRKQTQAAHSDAAEERISNMIKKNKTNSRSSLSLSWALLFIVLEKTYIDVPFQWKTPSELMKMRKNPSLNIIDNILVSKYWGIKTVFPTVDFCPWTFFCWNFKTKVVSCENTQATLQKTLRSKCDINFFEIALPPHSCLLWKFAIIVGDCSWYSFVVMMIFIPCIDLFQ